MHVNTETLFCIIYNVLVCRLSLFHQIWQLLVPACSHSAVVWFLTPFSEAWRDAHLSHFLPRTPGSPLRLCIHVCPNAHTHTWVYGMCSVRGSLCINRTCEAGYYGDRCGGVGPCFFFSDVGKRVINNEKETALKCKGWGVDMWVVSTFVNSGIHTEQSFYLRPVEPERDWNAAAFLLILISCGLIFMS